MSFSGTNPAGGADELLLEIDRAGGGVRVQLESRLREAIRSGRLVAGERLPASRALAADLGLSRRLVVEAYAQLLAEGYLRARRGSGTFVARAAAEPDAQPAESSSAPPAYDFFPGSPDLGSFPRRAWLRAQRAILRELPDSSLGYPDPRGVEPLRRVLATHLRRVRGVAAEPESIVVCSGARQALALLGCLLCGGRVAIEDPTLPLHRAVLQAAGCEPVALGVDGDGARVQELESLQARGPVRAALVTPAHQAPLGVALSRERRAALLDWARTRDALVIEDDYDAEFRYDRAPLGALQGLAPDRVVYVGTASKVLAPGLRLGWMVLPPRLVAAVLERRQLLDAGGPVLEQLTLARLIEDGGYDRHLRRARRLYRARRDTLVAAVARELPRARVRGIAAGLHAVVELGARRDALELVRAARRHSVGVYPLGYAYARARPRADGLVLGYAALAEPAIEEGIRRLALALAEPPPARTPTKDGGAIAR